MICYRCQQISDKYPVHRHQQQSIRGEESEEYNNIEVEVNNQLSKMFVYKH